GFRSRDSDTFLISFQSEDRDLAQRVASALAQSMIDEFVRDNLERTRAARDFLAEEEKRAETELDEKGRALAEFLATHPQYAWDETKGGAPAFRASRTPGKSGRASGTGSATAPLVAPSDAELAALYRERARLESLAGARERKPQTLPPELVV